ncbi:hypothetical protein DY000_02058471 [Brassica cretica]|uniref:Uncharacterized protein n=1 Tax=Brassica cretica TaxID=69181 RepID=A0ABQ7ATW1_BRACR|nr:hypothetical protein DY000_02058471 [Brassica cretica]
MAKAALRADVCGEAVSWEFKGRGVRPMDGSYHYWKYMIRLDKYVDKRSMVFLDPRVDERGRIMVGITRPYGGLEGCNASAIPKGVGTWQETRMSCEDVTCNNVKQECRIYLIKGCISWKNKTDRLDWDIVSWTDLMGIVSPKVGLDKWRKKLEVRPGSGPSDVRHQPRPRRSGSGLTGLARKRPMQGGFGVRYSSPILEWASRNKAHAVWASVGCA